MAMALAREPETVPQFRVTLVMLAPASVTTASTSVAKPGSGAAGTVVIAPRMGPAAMTGLCTPGVASVGVSTGVEVHSARLNTAVGVVTDSMRTMVAFSKLLDGTEMLSTVVPRLFFSFAPSLTLPFQVVLESDQPSLGKSTGNTSTVVASPATRAWPTFIDPERFQVKISDPLPTATTCHPVRSTTDGPEL